MARQSPDAQVTTLPIPADLEKFWRRVLKLDRGRTYLVTIHVPEQRERKPEWAVIGDGKIENT